MSGSLAPEYQDGRPTELINGKLTMLVPAGFNHNMSGFNLASALRLKLRNSECVVMGDNNDLFLTETDRFVPDVMVVCDRGKIRKDGVHGAPDLVVEVLSPSTARNDRGRKMRAYEKAGVHEYWLVDTIHRTVEQYVLRDKRFELEDLYSASNLDETKSENNNQSSIRSSLFENLEIGIEEIFEGLLEE